MTSIGIDMGGVVADTFYGPHMHSADYLSIKPVKGALASVQKLTRRYGPARVFIISKAGITTQAKARELLGLYDFYKKTGFLPSNLYFCINHEDKAPIAKKLELTHFVDDRHTVLESLEPYVQHCMLFGPQRKEITCNRHVYTPSWREVLAYTYQTS